jgi:tetratricopeptide (TPR) repeat protein
MRHSRVSALGLALFIASRLPVSGEPPAAVDALFAQGVQALKAGRLAEAETAFRRVLQQGGGQAYVHNNLALVYQQQGSAARVELARAYTRGGQPAAAVEQYRALREIAPDDPEYSYQLARAYLRLSDWAMRRLREIDPGSARIHQALGHNYRVQGRPDLAARAFERAAEADPKLPEIHLALAQIHLERKNYAEARREIDRELALVPESAGARALKQRLDAEEGR